MRHRIIAILAAAFLTAARGQTAPPPTASDGPVCADPRLIVTKFAAAPDIVHPIALDFDAKGRLLVIESHTHFRPKNYAGPKYDRIRVIEDSDGDGKADRFTTFFDGTTHTMDLAVHPDGSVYVTTRNEILRLRDTDGDGKADDRVRIAFLDTTGDYPHNGLSGLAFDAGGNLYFGMGENLGAPYKLIGADGTTLAGGGEGGNVFWCTADGKKLRRVATGFWNPFGSCRDIFGRLFTVDNDPDESPPCRLVHVVEGGDYGFQFRYGRAGRHPFQAWDGELPGTLPYMTGTGESPCEVVSYESDGLPAEYRGNLLVPAWADHRVERYVLRPHGATVVADRQPFVRGGNEFYPSGLAVAPDGSLFVSDWGSKEYALHGKGSLWHVRWKDGKPVPRPSDPTLGLASGHRPVRDAAARTLAKDQRGRGFLRDRLNAGDVRMRAAALDALLAANDATIDLAALARGDADPAIRAMAVRGLVARGMDVTQFTGNTIEGGVRAEAIAGLKGDTDFGALLTLLGDPDPFLRHAVIRRISQLPDRLAKVDHQTLPDAKQRIGVLLAWRASGHTDAPRVLADFLADPDRDVRFLAVKWVSDERLAALRPQLVEMLSNPTLDPRGLIGLATALARVDNQPVDEDGLAKYFLDRLTTPGASASTRQAALRAIPATQRRVRTDQLIELLRQPDPALRIEALRALKDRADAKAAAPVRAIAADAAQSTAVRAQALVTLSAMAPPDADFLLGLVADADSVLSTEALRALVSAKLTPAQRARLGAVAAGKPGAADLAARVLGESFHAGRPPATDTAAWLRRLDGPADPETGRRVFEHPRLAGCFRCHQVEGRGARVGPDLSLIGRTERHWILESILQPSAMVAPNYQAWVIQTTDGRSMTGMLVNTRLDESEYLNEKGERFKLRSGDMEAVTPSRNSIMPDRLLDGLTDQEARDLIAYLMSRK